jgi:creatinine amidohydrolase
VTRPYILSEANLNQIRQRKIEVAVLPWGACEPHNLHLPYGNDTLTVNRIGELICQRASEVGAQVCLLPAVPYGVNTNLMGFPMTISMNPTTQLAVVRDVIESLKKHGVRKLVILNGHGGNEFGFMLRELFDCGIFLTLVNWWTVTFDVAEKVIERPGEHADEAETSWALYLHPQLVAPLETADDGAVRPYRFEALNRGWARITRPWDRFTKQSGYGDPHLATADKGRQCIEVAVERLAKFLVELSAAEIDEKFPMA